MRRLLLVLVVAAAAALSVAVPAAQASATCTLHDTSIDWWAAGAQQINGSNHFKCGGAQSGNKGDYYIHYYLQSSTSTTGPWVTAYCINGDRCDAIRPGSGLYNGGQDYATTFWTFNVDDVITCLEWRIHTVVVFPNIPQVGPTYNDQQFIGGC